MSHLRVRLALLIALAGLFLLALPLASSSASQLPGAVTNVKIEQTTADRYQAVTVYIAFAIPAGAKAGDTFSVNLPTSLQAQNQTFPILAPDGSVVATAVVKNGVVTFTTTTYVQTHRDVKGTAELQVHFNQGQITPGQSNDFGFTSGGKTYHSPVHITSTPGNTTHSAPTKIGFWTDPADQGATTATDAVRWKLQSWAGPLIDLRFSDTLGPGQVNDCASVTIVSTTTFRANGDLKNPQPMGARAVLACQATSFVVTIASTETNEVVQVNYDSTITDQSQKAFTNQVDVTAKGRSRALSWKLSHYGAYGQGSGIVVTAPPTTTPATTPPSATTTARTTASATTATPSATTTARTATVEATAISRTTAIAPTTTSTLPFTGARIGTLSELAGGSLLIGGGLLLVGRRRRGGFEG